MAMGVGYSLELISSETYAPQFIEYNKLILGSVYILVNYSIRDVTTRKL